MDSPQKTDQSSCFIIAEAGVNHNGCINRALNMIQIAAKSGADAIKFQTFTAEKLVTKIAKTADYQKTNCGHDNQYEMLKQLELKESDYPRLVEECAKYNIEFMSTPFDEDALEMLVSVGMKRIKIPSGELTNLPFIRAIARKNLPLILSTGMGTLEEIGEAVHAIRDERIQREFLEPLDQILTILHCTSNYPCPIEQANLRAMVTIKNTFSLPIGYSDHTLGIEIAPICLGLGATVYEKHFTLDKNLPGPDHCASLDPDELTTFVTKIRMAEDALGSFDKKPTPSELEIRKIVRKSLALKQAKKAGDVIDQKDIHCLRPGTGIEPKFLDTVIGKRLKTDVDADTILMWEYFEI